jgi:hypothetical protein
MAEELGVVIQGTGLQELHRLYGLVWEKRELPTDWRLLQLQRNQSPVSLQQSILIHHITENTEKNG